MADFTKLSKSAKEKYKRCYCSLCKALSKTAGAKARFLLSFDMTFLLYTLLLASNRGEYTFCRCPYHLGKKYACIKDELCDYVANATVMLCYLNFKDDIKDSGSLKAKILCKMFEKDYINAKNNYPELEQKLTKHLLALEKQEQSGQTDFNVPADIFGELLGDVFSKIPQLYEFGFYLGRFIYLYDAVCDFKSDIKHARYNPLVKLRTADFEPLLTLCAESTQLALEKAKITDEVMQNVLEGGMFLKYSIKYKRKLM